MKPPPALAVVLKVPKEKPKSDISISNPTTPFLYLKNVRVFISNP